MEDKDNDIDELDFDTALATVDQIINSTSSMITTTSSSWSDLVEYTSKPSLTTGYSKAYLDEKELDKNCAKAANIKLKDIEGWTLLKIDDGHVSSLIDYELGIVTNEEYWIVEFKVLIVKLGDKQFIYVDQNCPDYYISDPDEILKMCKDSLKIENSSYDDILTRLSSYKSYPYHCYDGPVLSNDKFNPITTTTSSLYDSSKYPF